MNNSEIAEAFLDVAGLLELRGEGTFAISAYRRAARVIGELPVEMRQMVREGRDLKELPGVGDAIAKKVAEMVATGGLEYRDRMMEGLPDGIVEVMRLPGVGPKTAGRLWRELGVTSVEGLVRAIEDGRVADLPGMGERSAEKILRHVRSTSPGMDSRLRGNDGGGGSARMTAPVSSNG
jgi:DNA polymerase (family 10)